MDIKKRTSIFISSLLITLIVLRIFLSIFPSANLDIGKYNIHHLFVGAFLIIVAVIFFVFDIVNNFLIVLAGFSSGLILDEIVYLIATDGSDASYLTAVSLLGVIISTSIIIVITFIGYKITQQKVREWKK